MFMTGVLCTVCGAQVYIFLLIMLIYSVVSMLFGAVTMYASLAQVTSEGMMDTRRHYFLYICTDM